MNDLVEVAGRVIAALEHAGVPYTVGGSIASSLHGEPRASIDVDILVNMQAGQVPDFVQALEREFYVDEDAL